MTARQKLFILVSQIINVMLSGDPDETLSARAWRERHLHPWHRRIDCIFGKWHCRRVWTAQVLREEARRGQAQPD